MTYLWQPAEPVAVQPDEWAAPVSFRWRGQTHRVGQIAKRWRVDQAWWQGRIWRDYFKLTTDSGLLVILYRDLMTGRWYLQRLYD